MSTAKIIPEPIREVIASGSDEDAEALLQLLFAPHMLVDDPVAEYGDWFDTDHAFPVRRWYLQGTIPAVVQKIAPTWEDAIRVAAEWLQVCPHTCGDYDDWHWQRESLDDPSPRAFLKALDGL